jgi:hypothetical protein
LNKGLKYEEILQQLEILSAEVEIEYESKEIYIDHHDEEQQGKGGGGDDKKGAAGKGGAGKGGKK